MQSITNINLDDQLRQAGTGHVAVVETKPDPEDRHDKPNYEVMGAIQALLQRANLESENGFTVVIDVQGSTEAGRILQCVVLDNCLGPLAIH
jgi:hypothetical protein